MELIFGFHNLQPAVTPCVATIGNFDGVHLGHQAVIGHLAEKGAAMGLPTTLITFEPTPAEYFTRDRAPARLTTFREKYVLDSTNRRSIRIPALTCFLTNGRVFQDRR